jgi:hypothetical protein
MSTTLIIILAVVTHSGSINNCELFSNEKRQTS